ANNVFTVKGSHTYADEGTYSIQVTLRHLTAEPQMVTSTATVSDPPVVVTAKNLAVAEGAPTGLVTVATFTDPGGPEALGQYAATINWGDGTPTTTGVISFSGGVFIVQGGHTYAEESSPDHVPGGGSAYPLSVTVTHGGTPVTAIGAAAVADPAVVGT